MAGRHIRDFLRIKTTPATARVIVEHVVNHTISCHYRLLPCPKVHYSFNLSDSADRGDDNRCDTDCRRCGGRGAYWPNSCANGTCFHIEGRWLDIARIVNENIKIGKKRARLDFPSEPLEKEDTLSEQLADWLDDIEWIVAGDELPMERTASKPRTTMIPDSIREELRRISKLLRDYAKRSPLERLAECSAE